MGRRCVAYGCSNNVDTGRKIGITFHKFPSKDRDKKRFQEWLKNVRWKNWEPTKEHVLCSVHFRSQCFDVASQKARLLPSAVPTNFSFPPHLCKKQSLGRYRSAVRSHDERSDVTSQPALPRPFLAPVLLDHCYALHKPPSVTEDAVGSLASHSTQQGQPSDVQQLVQHGISCTRSTAVNAVLDSGSKQRAERLDSPVRGPSVRVKASQQVRYCNAPNCKNNGRSRPDLSMFRLPRDPERFDRWFANCGWKMASPSWFLCSEHFEEDQFVDKQKRDQLVSDAVPTIFVVMDEQLSSERPQTARGDANSLLPSITAVESLRNTSFSAAELRTTDEVESDRASDSETALYDTYGTPFILVGEEAHDTPHTTPEPHAREPLTPKEEPSDPDLPPTPEKCPISPLVEEISIAKEEVPELCESECPSRPDTQPLSLPSQLVLGTAGLVDGAAETPEHVSTENVTRAVTNMEEESDGACNGDVPMYDSYGTPFVLIEGEPPGTDHTHPHTPTHQTEVDVPEGEADKIFTVKEEPLDQELPEDMIVTSGLIYAPDTNEEEEEEKKEEQNHEPQVNRSSRSLRPKTQSKCRRRSSGPDVTPVERRTATPTSNVTHTTPTSTTAANTPPHIDGSSSGSPCIPFPLTPQTSRRTNTSSEEDNYVLVKRSKLNAMMKRTRCKTCRRDVNVFVEDDGLDVTLLVGCLCQGSSSTQECEFKPDFISSDSSRSFTEANTSAVYHVLASGDGYYGLQGFANSIGRPCMSRKTFQEYSAHLYDKMAQHFSITMEEAHRAVRKHYRIFLGQVPGMRGMDIAVMFGWTGLIPGQNTQLGIGVVMEADTGVVLDFEVLSMCCLCAINRMKLLPAAFKLWRATHRCHGNFNGPEHVMESAAARRLWQRSQRRGFWYTTFVGDSTSVAYLAVRGLETGVGTYSGCVHVVDCTKHFSEYLGARLQTLVENSERRRSKVLNGQLVNRITAVFTYVIKKNMNSKVEMAQENVSKALLHHLNSITQRTEQERHTNAQHGKNSTNDHKLLQSDVEKVKAVLNDFTSVDVITRCINGNINHLLPKFWLRMSREERIDVPRMFFQTRVAILENNFGKGAADFLATLGLPQGDVAKSNEGVKGTQKVL